MVRMVRRKVGEVEEKRRYNDKWSVYYRLRGVKRFSSRERFRKVKR